MELSSEKDLAAALALCAPTIGKTVKAASGQHEGRVGVVFWHGADRYASAVRYGDDNARYVIRIQGRYGYRAGVKTETGERFFVNADKLVVCVEK